MQRHQYRFIWASLIGSACLLAAVMPAQAIPVFARKYGFNCTMCHSTYPRLNDFGQRYRNNGYELPGREEDEQTVLEGPAPFAARTSAGYNYDRFQRKSDGEDINQFQINGLDILSGGLLAEDIGYLAVYLPEIHGSSGVAAQQGTLEMANVVFSHLSRSNLLIRAGRFEGAWLPFSAKRLLTFSPYEVYDAAGPSGLALSDTQTGVEITAAPRSGFRFGAGWVDGSSTNDFDDSPGDFYLRAAKVFGEGEGQTAGQRLGAFAYFGRARPSDPLLPDTGRHSLNRCGLDASLNTRQWNFEAQWLRGRDSSELWGLPDDYEFSGGFLQAMYLPSTKWVAVARYDQVNTPEGPGADLSKYTVAGRYYLADNIALHLEYSQRHQALWGTLNSREKFFTTRVDWAFL